MATITIYVNANCKFSIDHVEKVEIGNIKIDVKELIIRTEIPTQKLDIEAASKNIDTYRFTPCGCILALYKIPSGCPTHINSTSWDKF